VATGIISGLIAGWAYNRWSNIRLPNTSPSSGERRFVPIRRDFWACSWARLLGFGWPYLNGHDGLSRAVLRGRAGGAVFYGVLTAS